MSVVSHGVNPSIHQDPVRDRVWFEKTTCFSQVDFVFCFVMHERRFASALLCMSVVSPGVFNPFLLFTLFRCR